MDDADRAGERIEQFDAAALKAQLEAGAQRYEPLNLEGELCCAICLDPLAKHRIEYGICLRCKQLIEKQEARRASH